MTQAIADADDIVARKASFRIKLAYGMGSVAPGAFNTLGALNMFFYNQVIGVPAAVVGLKLDFQTFLWGLKSSDILVLGLLAMPTPIVAAMIAPRLGERFGKKRACMSLFFASVAIGNLPLLLKLTGVLTLEASPLLLAILGSFAFASGVCTIAGFILVSSMVSDIVEDVQAKTGERSEGLLMTADSLPNRVINSLSVALPGMMLAWVAFPAKGKPGPETMELMSRVGWIYLPSFVIISILSIGIWMFYRIDQQTHERNLRAVA